MELKSLENLKHRGAVGCDPKTGDGAGITTQIPHEFFKKECERLEIDLPEPGNYGAGLVFLPTIAEDRHIVEHVIESIVEAEEQIFLRIKRCSNHLKMKLDKLQNLLCQFLSIF